jgi:2-methylcitrate dehydratase
MSGIMRKHLIRVVPSSFDLPREQQLAWHLAEVATHITTVDDDVRDMVINRVIDDTAVALGALNRGPVINARAQALGHPREGGATVLGISSQERFSCEWAAWANNVAVRELDMHDTFLAADYAHPGDTIPPLVAVAQQATRSGADLMAAIVAAYEVHVALVKAICLHEHQIDHVAHLAPAVVCGLGALLRLDDLTLFRAINQAVHVAFSTRQTRKGEISSWKAYAPAHAGKVAVEAVDRAMRGETAPAPIYEGENSVITAMLGGTDAEYHVMLPEPGEPRRAILETYTKEYSAEYQAQALIDLAFTLRAPIGDCERIERVVVHTSRHTHEVIGTGSGDPQKLNPDASRETLDHSLAYILAVALQDGEWHHVRSYTSNRAHREDTIRLWRKIETREDPAWTERYLAGEAFGGRIEIVLDDGEVISGERAVADAHPLGARPMDHDGYVGKLLTLGEAYAEPSELARFVAAADQLDALEPGQLYRLNVEVPTNVIDKPSRIGIF